MPDVPSEDSYSPAQFYAGPIRKDRKLTNPLRRHRKQIADSRNGTDGHLSHSDHPDQKPVDEGEETPTEVHLAQSGDTDQKPVNKREKTAEISRIPRSLPFTMDMKNLPIRELLEYFLKSKCNDAWAEFEKKIRPAIRGAIERTLSAENQRHVEELIDTVIQQLIDKDFRRLRNMSWPHKDSIYGFVKVIGCHAAIDWYRANGRFQYVNPDDPAIFNQLVQKGDAARSAAANEQLEKIDKFLSGRTSRRDCLKEQAIFWFFYRSGYTDKEIAGLPDINLHPKKVENIRRQMLLEVKRHVR